MSPAPYPAADIHTRRIAGAVVLSLGIHAAVLAQLAPFSAREGSPSRPPLTVDVLLKSLRNVPPVYTMPSQRETHRPAPAASPLPQPKPLLRSDPSGPAIASPVAAAEPIAAVSPPPAGPSAERNTPADRPSPAAAPPDLDALAGQYGKQVADLLIARKRYPRLAQVRGWQGRVEVEARFSPGGRLGQVVITRSSGHETLDAAALELLQGAELPPPPATLTQADFRLRLPIEYRLQN